MAFVEVLVNIPSQPTAVAFKLNCPYHPGVQSIIPCWVNVTADSFVRGSPPNGA